MKAVILAGGLGTRLGNRTHLIPKPMVEIGQKPVIWHIMKIFSYYGINDFIICLGYKANVIKEYFLNFEGLNNDLTINLKSNDIKFHNNKINDSDWNVTLINTGLNTLKGGRIKRIENYLDPGINLLTYGDGVADVNIKELIEYHKKHKKLVTITGVHPPARFGELIEENGIVKSFEEKPQTSQGLINGGFMVFEHQMLDYLTVDEDCDFEIGALEHLSKENKVMVYKHQGSWECMDNERDVKHLNFLWKNKQAFWKVWN